MEIRGLIATCIAIVVVCLACGCASRTGWEFRVGIAPVTAVDNNSKLEQEDGSGK